MTRGASLALLLALLAAGCGASGTSSSTTTGAAAPATTTLGAPKPNFKLTLVTDGHTPKAGEPWHYTIRATNLDGSPVSGTAKPRVLEGQTQLDGIGWLGFSGSLEKTYTWKSDWRGRSLVFQVEMDGNGGAKYLDYRIHVK